MKLAFLELSGFRGFRDKVRFELPSGFSVIAGRNGAGKSTVFDAIDFVLTGTISKFHVTSAKGGGLQDHIWWVGDGTPESHYVSLGLVSDEGRLIVITHDRRRGNQCTPNQLAELLCLGGTPEGPWRDT